MGWIMSPGKLAKSMHFFHPHTTVLNSNAACGRYIRLGSREQKAWPFTIDTTKVTCNSCKRTKPFKMEALLQREAARMFEHGQGLAEYGMLIVLVAVIVIIILAIFGDAVGNIFSNIIEALPF